MGLPANGGRIGNAGRTTGASSVAESLFAGEALDGASDGAEASVRGADSGLDGGLSLEAEVERGPAGKPDCPK